MVKFGIQIEPQFGFDYKTVEKITLEAEKIGYDSLWSSDHLFLNDKSEEINCMEAWSLLAALASVTNKIKLGTLVTCNSYRYPSILAKIAATVDMISNGRLFFGFGAGWKEIEYDAYGIPFPSTKVRLEQMEEAIELIKLLWTEPKVTYEGKYYKIKDAFAAPKPVQKPYPPIMIGGMGEKVLLKIVAKHADWCNFFTGRNLQQALDSLEKHCDEIGRDPSKIKKSLFAVGVPIYVSESKKETDDFMEKLGKRFNLSKEKVIEHYSGGAPGSLAGKPEEVIERFQYYIDMGFEYFQVLFDGHDEKIVDYSKDFAELVMKKL